MLLPHFKVKALLPAPFQIQRHPNLLAKTISRLTGTDVSGFSRPSEYIAGFERIFPKMFRIVEGSASTITLPRTAPPHLQRIVHGRTRTCLVTVIPELQGEWLEAHDVQEYLEAMGIELRGSFIRHSIIADPSPSRKATQTRDYGTQRGVTSSYVDQLLQDQYTDPYRVSAYERHSRTPQGHKDWTESIAAKLFPNSYDLSFFWIRRDEGENGSGPAGTFSGLYSFMASPDYHALINSNSHGCTGLPESIISLGSTSNAFAKITIDLEMLIQKMAALAACIGPTPGIRKENIDRAVRESIL